MCLFIVNGCAHHVYIFICMHSNRAVCRTVWITAAEVGLINAAQMAAPLEFSSSLWHTEHVGRLFFPAPSIGHFLDMSFFTSTF